MTGTGQLVSLTITSRLLAGNRAEDTSVRPVQAYVPAAAGKGGRFPVIYLLAPWTNAGRAQFEWKPFREALNERLDRLIAAKAIPPVVVVAVDTYSRFGGSQYIDSEFFGPHARHVLEELIPFCEAKLPIAAGMRHRAVMGRSSGGFGALRFVMDHADAFAAAGCHSGDLGFELLFGGDLVTIPNKLAKYQGSVQLFLDYAWSAPKLAGGDVHLLMLLGMCGFYSPNADAPLGFDLPIDLVTGAINHPVWQRWLSHDPVRRAAAAIERLGAVKALYIECGNRDQYHLVYGARQFRQLLQQQGVRHEYQEFNDDHSGTEYRYDVSLPILTAAIQ
jgi:enterochelin esterase-like enzyme